MTGVTKIRICALTYSFVLARGVEAKLLALFGLNHLIQREHYEYESIQRHEVRFVRRILGRQRVVYIGQEDVIFEVVVGIQRVLVSELQHAWK